jgi:cation diffusion facilitator family transporter
LTRVVATAQTVAVHNTTVSPRATNSGRAIRSPAIRRTLITILVLNALVVIIKVYVGLRTSALSVLGAALESGLDSLNNVIGMVLVGVASQEPDEDHPYGHDKFETLGALAIVGFLSISCFELLREGVMQLVRHDRPRAPSPTELALLLLTAGINGFVVWYERRRGRELQSAFLLADATHTSADLYVTLLVFVSLVLTRSGLGALDPVMAIVVALVIAWNGYNILRESVPILVDQRGVDPNEIRRLAREIPRILDVRLIRSRSTPSGVLFAEVTIGVAAGTTVADAHELSDQVEARITEQLGASEVTVHVEPV